MVVVSFKSCGALLLFLPLLLLLVLLLVLLLLPDKDVILPLSNYESYFEFVLTGLRFAL